MDIICEVNLEYEKTVICEKGTKVLYLNVICSIYGYIEAEMLCYMMYREKLEKLGLKLNPYDKCVANKEIDKKQCTVAWHIFYNKISRLDKNAVLKIFFGKLKKVQDNRHDYLSMNIVLHEGKV